MAVSFDENSVYDGTTWVVLYPNAQGFQDKFLEFCRNKILETEIPYIDCEIEEYQSGGIFFHKEKTWMLGVSFKKSQFKKLGIYFRAQQFGNLMYYSLLRTVDIGFWGSVRGKGQMEILGTILSKCKNLAQREELEVLNELGDLVFRNAMESLDPTWEMNQRLFWFQRQKK